MHYLPRRNFLAGGLAAVAASSALGDALGQQPSGDPTSAATPRLPNLKQKTFGGNQFWTDYLIHRGWRIQRNAVTRHCRLLDGDDTRQAWGTYSQCFARFKQLRREKNLPPMSGKVVVLLHGLTRTRRSMEPLGAHLRRAGFEVANMSYASTRADIGEHAKALHSVLKNLPDAEEIYLSAHSLGNLIIRRYWNEQAKARMRDTPDPRIKRIVMLAPPNRGSSIAAQFRQNPLMPLFWGKSAVQIANWSELRKRLSTPSCEFGILAGAGGAGRNPLLKGEDDLVLTVEETKLAGATDFMIVPSVHAYIMKHPRSHECLLRFLQHGYFVASDQRKPIEGGGGASAAP